MNRKLLVTLAGIMQVFCAATSLAAQNIDSKDPDPASHSATEQMTLSIDNGLVSADLKAVPIGVVLESFSSQSGIKINISPERVATTISDRFTDLPVDAALQRLIAGTSYAMVRDNERGGSPVTEVYVVGTRPSPDKREGTTPGGFSTQEEVLESLDEIALPDDIKRAMRETYRSNEEARSLPLAQARYEALSQLVESLETTAPPNSEITRQLREKLHQHESLQ